MRKLRVIRGKRTRAPSYDDARMTSVADNAAEDNSSAFSMAFDGSLLRDRPSTHDRDKALLVALGVDGDVPLAQARVNAGLDAVVSRRRMPPDNGLPPPQKKFSETFRAVDLYLATFFPANDNNELVAVAA